MNYELTPEELADMRHALGLDERTGEPLSEHPYRHFFASSRRLPLWDSLCTRGLAIRRELGEFGGGCYYVTQKGEEAVRRAGEE